MRTEQAATEGVMYVIDNCVNVHINATVCAWFPLSVASFDDPEVNAV